MNAADRRQRIEDLCHAALERDATARAEFIAMACGDDEALRHEVEALLAHAETAERFLSTPLAAIAAVTVTDEPSASLLGRSLGAYQIRARIGSGGMGDVYRAHDTKLGREVAIKVLPRRFAADAERLARFEREARVLASLNHSNIATIHGLEERDGVRALVLELVEGDTLADRIARGPVPVGDALTIARQIAEALDAAHEKGIVHRDLKPANIKITPTGVLKVLDFGLAKLQPGDGADLRHSPTMSIGGTRDGVILGTAAYLSPEQARGQVVDKRADIWAFGCVLYETLTGRAAFARDTISDTLAAVLDRDPDWSTLPADTPPQIRKLLRRCLEKDRKRRIADAADVHFEIADALAAPIVDAHVTSLGPPTQTRAVNRWALLALAGLAAAATIGGAFAWRAHRQPTAVDWYGERLGGPAGVYGPRVSPDGQLLAFPAMVDGVFQVAVMKPGSGNWTAVTHNREYPEVASLSWSRDGTRIFFDRELDPKMAIFSVPALGGEERLVLENALLPEALPDGSLLVARFNEARLLQLYHVWLDSSRVEPLPAVLSSPARPFPDGREAVFWGRPLEAAETRNALHAIDLTSGRLRRLAPSYNEPQVSSSVGVTPDGAWVRVSRARGDMFEIVEVPRDGSDRIRSLATFTNNPNYIDVAADGTLYTQQAEQAPELISWSPASGTLDRLGLSPVRMQPAIALPLPDGRTLLSAQTAGRRQLMVLVPGQHPEPFVDTQEETLGPMAVLGRDRVAFLIGSGATRRVAIASLVGGRIQRRLTRIDGSAVQALAGTPDGTTLFYAVSGGVWTMPADGGEPTRLHDGDSVAVDPQGRYLVVTFGTADEIKLTRVSLTGDRDQQIPVSGDFRVARNYLMPNAIGPDGRIAVTTQTRDSPFWIGGILDPRNGSLTPITKGLAVRLDGPGWAPDGRLVSGGNSINLSLWRFRPRR